MAMNISCKFEKASYTIFFVRAVTVKSLYTLWRRRNEVKSIVSTGCYPVDTIIEQTIGKSFGNKYRSIITKKLPDTSEVMELHKTTLQTRMIMCRQGEFRV